MNISKIAVSLILSVVMSSASVAQVPGTFCGGVENFYCADHAVNCPGTRCITIFSNWCGAQYLITDANTDPELVSEFNYAPDGQPGQKYYINGQAYCGTTGACECEFGGYDPVLGTIYNVCSKYGTASSWGEILFSPLGQGCTGDGGGS